MRAWHSMTTARSRQRFASFRIPEHVLVVNYFGIPVSGSISFGCVEVIPHAKVRTQ